MAKSKQLLDADLIKAYLNGDYDGGKIRPLTAAEARGISSIRASISEESRFQRQADLDAEAKERQAGVDAARAKAIKDKADEQDATNERNMFIELEQKAKAAAETAAARGLAAVDKVVTPVVGAHDKIAALPTPGGIGILLAVLVFFVWAIVPVNGKHTRLGLLYLTIIGQTRLKGRVLINNGVPAGSGGGTQSPATGVALSSGLSDGPDEMDALMYETELFDTSIVDSEYDDETGVYDESEY